MKKKVYVLSSLITAAALAMTACSSGGGTDPLAPEDTTGSTSGSTQNAGDRATITFAAAMFAESGRGPKLEALVQDFNDSQDEFFVEPATVPFSSFGQTIFTQMGGGGGPDIIRFDHTDFYAAADAGLLIPIDELIDTSGYDFLAPDQWSFYDGTRYGIHFEISNYTLIYNPDLIDAPPTDFESFLAVAEEATTGGNYGFATRTTMQEQAGMWFDVSNFVYGFGGTWSKDGEPTFNTPEVVEGVERFVEVVNAGVIPEGADAATYRRMFAEGKIAMMIDNGGVPPIVLGQNPDVPIDAVIVPFPSGSMGQVITPLGVNANSKHPEAAAAFLEWLLEPENQVKNQEVVGASSPATRTERTAAQIEALPYAPVFDEATETGIPYIVAGMEVQTPELRQKLVEAVVSVIQGQSDAQTALDGVQELAESLKTN